MLIAGIALGLILGLAAGGSIWNLSEVRLRWLGVLLPAVILRFGTELALTSGVALAETLRLPLFASAYGLLLAGLWANRHHPGLSLAFVGILANALAIVVNDGRMPIWEPSLIAAGLTRDDVDTTFHSVLATPLDASFLLRLGPLVDVIPVPFPWPALRNVASIGDVFLSAGLGFFLFATVLRTPATEMAEEEADEAERQRFKTPDEAAARTETGLYPGLADAAMIERPMILGGSGAGVAAPGITGLAPEAAGPSTIPLERPRVAQPGVVARARRHPYVRLALNPSYSALWTGQVVSLFGDRIHQVALAFLVLGVTDSAVAVGAVFAVATLPNLLFSPIAGTLVDRWDQRKVLIMSDLLRAGLVLLVPAAAAIHIALIYPLVFLITTVSIFFRPARIAIMPRIVERDELLTANSAAWVGETLADVIGYPLAGLFVAFLGDSIGLAFWIDGATYLASAVLLWSIVVPPVVRRSGAHAQSHFVEELKSGWRFLRGDRPLLANTVQAAIGQFTIGILVALAPVYARDAIQTAAFDAEAVYSFLETGIGAGNLLGGFVLGLVGTRFARGRMVITGYAGWGLCTALLGLTGNLGLAVGLMFGSGIANMVFVIPSQTLFQERTPAELMGRVVSFRSGLVFGSMTIAMAIGGVLGETFGAAPVIATFGLLTMLTGLAGLLVPAVRDA